MRNCLQVTTTTLSSTAVICAGPLTIPQTTRDPLTFLMVSPAKGALPCGERTEMSTAQPLREVREHGFEACDADEGSMI
jgi:hypothetical protein